MLVPKTHDVPLFTRRRLLVEYSYRIQNWATHANSLALMNGSLFLRDVFAFAATNEAYDSKELYGRILQKNTDDIDFRYEWLFRLGRLVALQNMDASDASLALFCLEESTYNLRLRSHRIENLRLQVELLAETKQFEKAREVLSSAHSIYGERYEYLTVDLDNPFVNPAGSSIEEWLDGFNRPFRKKNLSGVHLSNNEGGVPFDRLQSEPSHGPMPNGPLVSVIMTSYAPDEKAFELAARSILNQSWWNLELVVVDDATPGGAPRILEQLAGDDPRVRIVQLQENRGTYYARNAGLRAATGHYVTGQDSDDWSHPDRLYRQVRALQNDDAAVGVVTKATRSDDNLFRILRGIEPDRLCEVSLMFPADVGRKIGGYLESRKGADSEFRLRLEIFSERSVKLVDEPLYLTRLSSGSLSRSDFKRGWAHQNRRAFSNVIKHWHKTANPNELILPEDQSGSDAIPPKFRSRSSGSRSFDYVFLSDWRFDDASTRSALSEIEALQTAGKIVGLMQSSGLFSGMGHTARLSEVVQRRINSDEISLVIPDESAEIENLIVRNAELLHFAPEHVFQGEIGQLFIVADQPPSAWDGSSPIYHPELCSRYAFNEFGKYPMWLAQDPAIHRYLTSYAGDIQVWPYILPHVLPVRSARSSLGLQPTRRRHTVVGRHSRNIEGLWPDDLETANGLWPAESNSGVEVRIFGGAQCYLQKFNKDFYPTNWVAFRSGDISQDAFHSSIDYFVYFPDEKWPQEISYDALIAYANGCKVILPERFARSHKDQAVYSRPQDVLPLIYEWGLPARVESHEDVVKEAKAAVCRSRHSFVEAINSLTHSFERQGSEIG